MKVTSCPKCNKTPEKCMCFGLYKNNVINRLIFVISTTLLLLLSIYALSTPYSKISVHSGFNIVSKLPCKSNISVYNDTLKIEYPGQGTLFIGRKISSKNVFEQISPAPKRRMKVIFYKDSIIVYPINKWELRNIFYK